MGALSHRQQQMKAVLARQRLAHIACDKIAEMGQRGLAHGMPHSIVIPDDPCVVCLKAKGKALPHGKAVLTEKLGPGAQIHVDFAFSSVVSYRGFSSILTCVDAWSQLLWLFCMRSKHPPLDIIRFFYMCLASQGRTPQALCVGADKALACSAELLDLSF